MLLGVAIFGIFFIISHRGAKEKGQPNKSSPFEVYYFFVIHWDHLFCLKFENASLSAVILYDTKFL
jgi:hypothetical protein